MASIFIEISVPDVIKENFISPDFNPFSELALKYMIDTDDAEKMLTDLLLDIKYQSQRNEKTINGVS